MSHATHSLLETAPSTTDLTESERHRLLEVDRRRHVLAVLPDDGDSLTLEELAAAVAVHESDVDADDPAAVSRLATTLHHVHLPKMDDAGVLAYDPAEKRILP